MMVRPRGGRLFLGFPSRLCYSRQVTNRHCCWISRVLLFVVVAAAPLAVQAQGRRYDDPELTRASELIVTGRVSGMSYGRDPQVGAIYTYVTVDVDQTIKGPAFGERIVVKQLGGSVDGVTMTVFDQAAFEPGQEVLLFLVRRPRDQTLQTIGLWQGKWTIERDAAGSAGAVTRTPFGALDRAPGVGAAAQEDTRLLAPFLAELRSWSDTDDGALRSAQAFDVLPADAPAAATAGAVPDPTFNLLGPGRWNEADSLTPVRVDIQASGEPGLPGGGFGEIAAGRSLWNNVGSSMALVRGAEILQGADTTAACSAANNSSSGRVTIVFDDPCMEIGGSQTLAVGGTYSTQSGGRTVNGTSFARITAGFVIFSDGESAQNTLDNNSCFQDVAAHEMGHSVGIGHTGIPGNLMLPNVDGACFQSAAQGRSVAGITGGLGPDDIAALKFIYPPPASNLPDGPNALPGPPRGLTATLSGERVILEWLPPFGGGRVTSYQIQGGSGPGQNNLVNFDTFQNATRITLNIGDGEYFLRVRARNSIGLSNGSSNEVMVVVTDQPPSPNPEFVTPTINLTSDAAGNAVVFGEIQNRVIGAGPPTFIRVDADFLGPGGGVVGSRFGMVRGRSRRLRNSGMVTDTALLAGQRGCFAILTNIPASQIAEADLTVSWETFDNDPLQGRLRVQGLTPTEGAMGDLLLTGTARNIGSRATFFNRVIFDLKTPKVQACQFTFVTGSTVPVPGGGTTPSGLAPGQQGTFSNFTGLPFGPIELRRYTTWDESAAPGAAEALGAFRGTSAAAAAMIDGFELARELFRQIGTARMLPSAHMLDELWNDVELRLQELERSMAPSHPTRLQFGETLRVKGDFGSRRNN